MKYGELTLGQIESLVNKLGGMTVVNEILSDTAQVSVSGLDLMVDGNTDPFVPKGWKIEEHKTQGDLQITRDGGNLFVDGVKIDFYVSEDQRGNKIVDGDKLRKELADKPTLSACVLDRLVHRSELIPESWKRDASGNTLYVYFWGTIYRNHSDELCVRALYWGADKWHWRCCWVDEGCRSYNPAAVLAS